jgi:predicted RNA-binding Zn ribbon-like protein
MDENTRPFLWVGNHPGIDLVNTESVDSRGDPLDLVPRWTGLVDWAQEAGLIDSEVAQGCRAASDGRGRTVLTWFRRLRSSLSDVLASGDEPSAARELDAAVAAVAVRLRYQPSRYEHRRHLDAAGPLEQLRLALSAAALDATELDRSRVRRCANPRCALLFHDTTKNRSRRWCSMATCGNRAKARAHYRRARHHAERRRRAVVLVEGASDQAAVVALAARRGRNLDAEGVEVVPIGGAKNIRHFLERFGPQGADVRLAGLYDAGEERDFKRGLERTGFGANLTRADLDALGFYVCVADLEDELIRALGSAAVERVVDAQGELGSFRTFQKQPAQQGRTSQQHLRRFMGTRSGRKVRYATLLVDALDLNDVPRPLNRVLAHV